MSEKNNFLKEIEIKRREFFLKIISRLFPKKIQSLHENKKGKEIIVFSRRGFLQLSSFITSASFLPLFISKKAKAFGGFGLMRQGAAATLYVDDVFSAYTYTGNGTTQTITNGIDLNGKGGMVWIKGRTQAAADHILTDTMRGNTSALVMNGAGAAVVGWDGISGFNNNGFAVGTYVYFNGSASSYSSWTFRKAAKFFDVVTYTGTGVARQISHNLGSTPGMIVVKNTSATGAWFVYHTSLGNNQYVYLNQTDAVATNSGPWNSTSPTNAQFTIGTWNNDVGVNYVAYLFAHDTSASGIIQCGSYVDSGTGTQTITLGWEPQFLIYRSSTIAQNWVMLDSARGWPVVSSSATQNLYPNLSNAENSGNYAGNGPTGTGFTMPTLGAGTYIYMAIRRPNKPPTLGTQVYNAIARTGTGAAATVTGVGFAPDLVVSPMRINGGFTSNAPQWMDRLRGLTAEIWSSASSAETLFSNEVTSFGMDGVSLGASSTAGGTNWASRTYINWFFKRAPGFFDIVCYTGVGGSIDIIHNLGVAPELYIVKARSNTTSWAVGSSLLTYDESLALETTNSRSTVFSVGFWQSKFPTATTLYCGSNVNTNAGTITYVAYLFASKLGISKVGTYNGTNASQNIDCGFTAGPRFVLIKRIDATGDWYAWDSIRGITTLAGGNDPHLSLNTNATEVTTDDSIDTYITGSNSGFTVKQNATTNLNLYLTISTASYIYLAIA